MSRQKTLLILSQVYVPDPAAVGQHLADVAAQMAGRGHRVVVLTANRGYNDPSAVYPRRERIDGVTVRRMPWCSFGKRSILLRVLGGVSFVLQATVRGLWLRGLSAMLVSTSPPMCAVVALTISLLRRVPYAYWVMDLNPDQMVAMGWIRETSPLVRVFRWFNGQVLRRARCTVTLDPFMAARVRRMHDPGPRLKVMPPWPHERHLEDVAHAENPFRTEHGLDGRRVVMYSGNHSVCTPLRTVLDAALLLRDHGQLVFMFIGAGTGKPEVDGLIARERPPNMISLPYQPLERIRYSLSAADVHMVVVGNNEVGMRHPCKIYDAMALGRPILLIGPDPCHASELVRRNGIGWHLQHGDVDGAVRTFEQISSSEAATLRQMGRRARAVVDRELAQGTLCPRFCDYLEGMLPDAPERREQATSRRRPEVSDG